MGRFERYLPVWVALFATAGIAGSHAPLFAASSRRASNRASAAACAALASASAAAARSIAALRRASAAARSRSPCLALPNPFDLSKDVVQRVQRVHSRILLLDVSVFGKQRLRD